MDSSGRPMLYHAKFHPVPSQMRASNFNQILKFGGYCVHPFLSPIRATLAKKPHIRLFSTSSFCGGSGQRYIDEVQCRCTTTNLPLSNDIKINSVLQRVGGEVTFTIFVISKRDWQKRTNVEHFRPPHQMACDVRAPPNMESQKRVRIRPTVSPLGALKIWGKCPLNLHPHNSKILCANPPIFNK